MACSLAHPVNDQAGHLAQLNAFVAAAPDRPAQNGPLAGLTFALKDMFDWAGRAPTCGLATPPEPVPAQDAALVTALLSHGAVCKAFAEMTPLAFEASGGNFERVRPINPRDPARICGGSSSGSAVAVAAGLVDFAVGSDTAGSVRIPAHCCCIAAWKPSYGLMPLDGAMTLAASLDVAGFLAPDVAGLARIAAAFLPAGGNPVQRVAVASDLECADAGLMDAIAGKIGASRMALAPVLAACDPSILVVLQAEAAREHAPKLARIAQEPAFARRICKGLETTEVQLQSARAEMARLRAGAEQMLFSQADIIILPAIPIATPLVSECEPGSPTFSGRTLYALAAYTRFASALGLPVIVVPAGRDAHGMPVAIQIVGRCGSDADLIAFAANAGIEEAGRY